MNEEKHVQIIVAGYPGTGKSTVAHIIHEALEDYGFKNIEVEDDMGPISQDRAEFCATAIQEAGNTIHVQTRQLQRATPSGDWKPVPQEGWIDWPNREGWWWFYGTTDGNPHMFDSFFFCENAHGVLVFSTGDDERDDELHDTLRVGSWKFQVPPEKPSI